jgi:hypothetical protein
MVFRRQIGAFPAVLATAMSLFFKLSPQNRRAGGAY